MSELYNDVRDAHERQVALATERFADSETARTKNQRAREKNGTGVHDSLERLEARAGRLLARNETPADAIVKVAVSPTTNKRLALERIIDASNELQSWTFLPRGARAARTVARISTRDNGRELPLGTGFLVSPRLLMTNNHVLPSVEAAESVVVEFSAELDIDNQPQISSRFELDPTGLFITDDHLDMTLVLLRPAADGKPAGEHFGWNEMIRQQGKIVVGESVNVIGHPNGRLKEIAIRSNRLLLLLPDFLHYSTDTEPGNSGSPVYNDQWEVVGLHHAGRAQEGRAGAPAPHRRSALAGGRRRRRRRLGRERGRPDQQDLGVPRGAGARHGACGAARRARSGDCYVAWCRPSRPVPRPSSTSVTATGRRPSAAGRRQWLGPSRDCGARQARTSPSSSCTAAASRARTRVGSASRGWRGSMPA